MITQRYSSVFQAEDACDSEGFIFSHYIVKAVLADCSLDLVLFLLFSPYNITSEFIPFVIFPFNASLQ